MYAQTEYDWQKSAEGIREARAPRSLPLTRVFGPRAGPADSGGGSAYIRGVFDDVAAASLLGFSATCREISKHGHLIFIVHKSKTGKKLAIVFEQKAAKYVIIYAPNLEFCTIIRFWEIWYIPSSPSGTATIFVQRWTLQPPPRQPLRNPGGRNVLLCCLRALPGASGIGFSVYLWSMTNLLCTYACSSNIPLVEMRTYPFHYAQHHLTMNEEETCVKHTFE